MNSLSESSADLGLVSVIIATYNRPAVLRYALKSLVAQSYQNLEIIVVGDNCESSTRDAVNSLNDPRITYTNLPENCGEQSGPNNYGLSRSTGKYIAFLNHDDLFFPDHIFELVYTIESKKCDLAYSLFSAPHKESPTPMVNAMQDDDKFNIQLMYPASSFMVTREVYENVGGWQFYKEIYDMPSQDWVFRIHKSGYKIRCSNVLTMIAIQSGKRENSYIGDQSEENEYYFDRLQSNYLALRSVLLTEQIQINSKKWNRLSAVFRTLIGQLVNHFFSILNIRIRSVRFWWRFKKKGGFIDFLRGHRGLNSN